MASNTNGKTGVYKPPFASLFDQPTVKTFGGTKIGTADPVITGYGGIYFDELPDGLSSNLDLSTDEITKLLVSSSLSITVPSITLNKTTLNGIGGKKWSVITNVDVGDSISIRFTEWSSLPLAKIFYAWTDIARSPRHHSSKYNSYKEYTKSAYSCTIYYWMTTATMDPSADAIEIAFAFTGCFPDKVPTDAFGLDVNTNDKVEHDITFNVDEMFCSLDPDGEWLLRRCETIAKTNLNWEEWKGKTKSTWGGPSNQ